MGDGWAPFISRGTRHITGDIWTVNDLCRVRYPQEIGWLVCWYINDVGRYIGIPACRVDYLILSIILFNNIGNNFDVLGVALSPFKQRTGENTSTIGDESNGWVNQGQFLTTTDSTNPGGEAAAASSKRA